MVCNFHSWRMSFAVQNEHKNVPVHFVAPSQDTWDSTSPTHALTNRVPEAALQNWDSKHEWLETSCFKFCFRSWILSLDNLEYFLFEAQLWHLLCDQTVTIIIMWINPQPRMPVANVGLGWESLLKMCLVMTGILLIPFCSSTRPLQLYFSNIWISTAWISKIWPRLGHCWRIWCTPKLMFLGMNS